jgi:hypothetical protein
MRSTRAEEGIASTARMNSSVRVVGRPEAEGPGGGEFERRKDRI